MGIAHASGGRLGLSAALFVGLSSAIPAYAAQTDITIAVEALPTTPQIHSPSIIGWKPGTPFLTTIAATGTAPLTFSAIGLPAGLSLAADSGTISGTTPAAGSYSIAVTVSNAVGSATTTVALASGSTLALTPPMGWNSYDSFGATVTEGEFMAAAQAIKKNLQPFGWNTVVIDYLWFDPEQVTDNNGRWLPSPSKWPSAAAGQGFKPIADRVHALGLSFGIHIMRGIPRKSTSANSPINGSSFNATQAANMSDPCTWDNHNWGVHGDTPAGQAWYDSIFAQYAAWGIDFVKVDDMLQNSVQPYAYRQSEVHAIRAAIDKGARSVVLSLSPGPMPTSNGVDLETNANAWRMVNDFWDQNSLSSLPQEFDAAGRWQALTTLAPGHWPDADMLPLGYLGPRCPVHASGPTAFSHNEQVTVMTLWSILPSPLMFGGNVAALSTDATGPWTTALLTNQEVLAINQDALGAHARRIAQQGTTEVWARDLSGGRKAVALFNRGTADANVAATFAQLGVSGMPAVRDIWHRTDVGGITTGLSVTVPHAGALMYLLSPPAGPDAGVAGNADSGVTGASDADGRVDDGSASQGSSADGSVADTGAASGGQSGGGTGASSGAASSASGSNGANSGGSNAGEDSGAFGLASGGALSGSGATSGGGSPGEASGRSGCGCRSAGSRVTGSPYLAVALFVLSRVRPARRRSRKSALALPESSRWLPQRS